MNASITDSRRQALRSASHWYAVLSGERVSPQQEARWQQWYAEDKDHQWAWQQVENLRSQLSGAIATAIVRPLIQVLSAEDAAFFFYEMSDEDVQTIRQAAESAVEIE